MLRAGGGNRDSGVAHREAATGQLDRSADASQQPLEFDRRDLAVAAEGRHLVEPLVAAVWSIPVEAPPLGFLEWAGLPETLGALVARAGPVRSDGRLTRMTQPHLSPGEVLVPGPKSGSWRIVSDVANPEAKHDHDPAVLAPNFSLLGLVLSQAEGSATGAMRAGINQLR